MLADRGSSFDEYQALIKACNTVLSALRWSIKEIKNLPLFISLQQDLQSIEDNQDLPEDKLIALHQRLLKLL